MPFEEARINRPKKKRRGPLRTCPKVTPWYPPKHVSKKAMNGGRCNYWNPIDRHCSHWKAKDSLACPCHVEVYEGW